MHLLRSLLVFLLAFMPILSPAYAQEAGLGAAPAPGRLAQFLSSDGQLNMPADFVGSVDPRGFRLIQSGKSAPRFVPDFSLNKENDKLFGVPAGCNGPVRALARAASGEIYLGGEFTICDDVPAARVAAYDPLTRSFRSLGIDAANGLDGAVHAIAVSGNDLYVGGLFTQAGGLPANRVARWNGSIWSSLGNNTSNGVDADVDALAVSGGTLFLGGDFSTAGGIAAKFVARWNGSTWSAVGGGQELSGRVRALAVAGSDLYVGGEFTQVSGAAANFVARWNGNAWSTLGTGGANGVNAPVYALAADGNSIYVGGEFVQAGGAVANHVARWTGSAWATLGSGAENGVNDFVFSLAISGSHVYVGGFLTRAGSVPAAYIARWNGSQWAALENGEGSGLNSHVFAISVVGTNVYAGGALFEAGGNPANFVARWDGSVWSSLGAGNGDGVNGRVYALAVSGSDLYVGGEFTQAGGVPANFIARWNGSVWSSLGTGSNNGVDNSVRALGFSGSTLYVGGDFSTAGGVPAKFVARWDGNNWSSLGTGASNGLDDGVYALAVLGSEVYVGGYFANAGGASARAIARWNGTAWASLGSGPTNGVDGSILALAVLGTDLYAGGFFTQAGSVAASHVARWNGTQWASLGTGAANGTDDQVDALAVSGSQIFVGGRFTMAGGQPANYVARWADGAWSSLGSPGTGNGTNGFVAVLTVSGSDLYVGGSFTRAAGLAANGLARWNGLVWSGLSTDAPPQTVTALTSDGGALYANGSGLTQTPLPELQTKARNGGPANGASRRSAVSRRGDRIAFQSDASDLTVGDNNGRGDIFLRDLITGMTTRASEIVDALNPGAQESFTDPALSEDGRSIAFVGSSGQIYGSINGIARRLSTNAGGIPANGPSGRIQLPGGGTLVLFESQATNLLSEGDGNGSVSDIFMKNLLTGAITLISRGPNGQPGNGPSVGPWVATNGSTIVFSTLASNLISGADKTPEGFGSAFQAVMVQDAQAAHRRIPLSRNRQTGLPGNGDSFNVRITPNGRFGVFESSASNLVPGDTNVANDVFFFEMNADQVTKLERVSVSSFGIQANAGSKNPSISDDGQFVSFETDASNLTELDRNGSSDVVVKWIDTGEVLRLSRTVDGRQPNAASVRPEISGDGSTVAFSSMATNLAPNDSNALEDVFAIRLKGLAPVNPSGAWYDPAQDGHGLQVQLLAGNRILAFWYTFDPAGNLAYFIGDGPFDGSSVTLTNLRPMGTFFPPAFNSSQVSLQAFGSMRLEFSSCGAGRVSFDLPSGFGQGSMNLTRLTQPAGVNCGSTLTTTATGPMAGASGAWYNPAMNGQGLIMESLPGGLLLATWYAYGPAPLGGQAWLTGLGSVQGNTATLRMLKLSGGRFIPNFNPALITRPELGTATITLNSCSSGSVTYAFAQGFGSGTIPLERLTTLAGSVCTEQ